MTKENPVGLVDTAGNPIKSNDTSYFGASRSAREFRYWNPLPTSADAAILEETETITARAHDLERNHGVASGYVRTLQDNVVGPDFRLAAKPDYIELGRTKEWADAWAKDVEAKWRTYAHQVEFSAARNLTFAGASNLVLRSLVINGEFLALPLWNKKRRWRTCFQFVDPARLSNPLGQVNGRYLRGGCQINRFGETVAYYIQDQHPGDIFDMTARQFQWTRIPARMRFGRRRVLHGFEVEREDQHRGVSAMVSVMGGFKMLDHYSRTELQTAVVNAMIAAFIETPLDSQAIADMWGGDVTGYVNARADHEVKLEGASVIPLYPGDKATSFMPSRPSPTFEPFTDAMFKHLGAGLNMPKELLLKDFSQSNYSNTRAALLEAGRFYLSTRQLIKTYWADPVYQLWLEEAVDAGDVEAPDYYANQAAYGRCQWIGPGRGWVDPTKEAQAAQTRMEANISTLERECAEQSQDWEEVLEQLAREKAKKEELGLSISVEDMFAATAPNEDEGGNPSEEDDDNADG